MPNQHIRAQTTHILAGLGLIGLLIVCPTALAAPDNVSLSAPTEVVWSTYHSTSGGFSLAIPSDWSADESIAPDGVTTLTLTSGDAAQGISVHTASLPFADTVDLPNQMCWPLLVGGLSGVRCLDTLSRATIVTFSGPTSHVQLVTAQRGDPSIFDQVLASFAPDGSPAPAADPTGPPAQITLPSTAPQTDLCGPRTSPISKANPLCPMP
ncbi:MAG: hypothetical protein NVSMB2_26910 [Chloroflexota bacterium]